MNPHSMELKPNRRDGDIGPGRVKRALFVAYAFPPTGGVSVQRVTKFVKYLPEFNWACSVLTVENPSVPMFDQSLLKEIPASTLVRRAKTFEPGYATKSILAASQAAPTLSLVGRAKNKLRDLARRSSNFVLQPDAQILWRPHALREGLKLLREVPHDVIVATGPPFSSFLVAMTLSRKTGVPVVVDFRDEWTVMTYWENKQIGIVERFVQRHMQGRVLRHAALVLGTTPSTADELKRLTIAAKSNARVENIYNGFDPSDYPTSDQTTARIDYGHGVGLFRLAFVGTLWNVTPIGPVVDAIIELSRRAPELAAHLELVVAGRRTSQQEAELDRLARTPVKLARMPFVPHKDAIALMCRSDALLLINADLPNTERLVNAKTFEYMAARRPIFAVAPEGELWNLLARLPGTLLSRPGDVNEIAVKLETAIGRWQSGKVFDTANWQLQDFERRNLAGRLAGFLDELSQSRAG